MGERCTRHFLNNNNVTYESQYKFQDCVYKNKLIFDFYLPNHNILIEYDGQQHHNFDNFFHKDYESFEEQQLRDRIKDNYCYVNKIKLIRIPYWEFDNIENILDRHIK